MSPKPAKGPAKAGGGGFSLEICGTAAPKTKVAPLEAKPTEEATKAAQSAAAPSSPPKVQTAEVAIVDGEVVILDTTDKPAPPPDAKAGEEAEEVFASDEGTAETRDFDAVIGALEDILVGGLIARTTEAHLAAAGKLSAANEHEQYISYKALLEKIEAAVDAEVGKRITTKTLEEIGALVESRLSEVSADVIDLVTGSSLEFTEFQDKWRAACGEEEATA